MFRISSERAEKPAFAAALPGVRRALSIGRPQRLLGTATLIVVLMIPVTAGAVSERAVAGSSGPAPLVSQAPHRLRNLAEKAKAAFHREVDPPVPDLTIFTIIKRTEGIDGTTAREYVLRSFDSAIDALLAEATTLDRTRRVEAALRKLVTTGNSDAADAILAEVVDRETATGTLAGREAAAAVRNSVALAELPAALARLMKSPNAVFLVMRRGKTGKPLGQLALPAYRHAAQLDPSDPWTWIAITWMSVGADMDAAAGRAVAAAEFTDDYRAQVAALQLRGVVRQLEGRLPEAQRSFVEALQIAGRGADANPGAATGESDVALGFTVLGEFFARQGQQEKAKSAYDQALELRKHLAAADPENSSRQVDIVELEVRMGQLTKVNQASALNNEASQRYDAIASRYRFTPTLKPDEGAVMEVFIQAGVLTLIGGFALLALYRRRVGRLMKAASVAARTETQTSASPASNTVAGANDLTIRSLAATTPLRTIAPLHSASISAANGALRRAAWTYTLAGAAFGGIATFLFCWLSDLEFAPVRTGTIFLAWAWPTVLVLGLLWGRDRRKLGFVVGGYFGLLLLLCARAAAAHLPPILTYGVSVPAFFQPLVFWAITVFPTLFLLLFLNRNLRSVGAVLLVFLLVAGVGGLLAKVAISTPAGTAALASLMTLLHVPAFLAFLGLPIVQGLGMALLVLPAWWAIGGIRRAYQAKWLSDQTLVFDAIWLFQAVLLSQELIHEVGMLAWVGLSAFLAYKLVTFVGLRSLAATTGRRPIARMLLLRVFGFQRRAERLFDLLGGRWRYAGPIQMIAAPDLASSTIGPDKFMDFLSRRLQQRFIVERADLERRFAELDMRPDADGRFRVNEFLCGNDSWQAAVQKLMADSELVVMDLRGFSPRNQGCLFELQSLLDIVPATGIVLLIDVTTDVPFLHQTLSADWERLDPSSPNVLATGAVTLLDVSESDVAAVDRLLEIADDVLAREKNVDGAHQSAQPADVAGLVPSQ